MFTEALKFFQKMPEINVLSWTTMVSGFAQSGLVDEALKDFKETPQQNVVSRNAITAGFAQNGYSEEALKAESFSTIAISRCGAKLKNVCYYSLIVCQLGRNP